MLAILDRRDAALLYTALMSMREEVRAWILARPALVRQLCGADAGPLLVAAPYLRIDGDRWQLPGGPAAAPIWLAVAGVTSDAPEPLLLALLRGRRPPRLHAGGRRHVDRRAAARGAVARERRAQPSRRRRPGAARRPAHRRARLGPSRAAVLAAVGRSGVPPRSAARRRGRPAARCPAAGCSGRSSSATAAWCRATPRPVRRGTIRRRSRRDGSCRGSGSRRRPISRCATNRCCSRPGGSRQPTRRRRPRSRRSSAATRATRSSCASSIAWVSTTSRALPRWSTAPTAWRRPRPTGAATRRWCAGRARSSSSITWPAWAPSIGDELHRALDALAAPEPASASRGTRVRALLAGLGVGAVAGDPPSRAVEDALVARLTRSRLGAGRRVTWEGQAYRIDLGAAERDRIARVRGRDAQARLDAAWSAFALSDLRGVPDAPDAMARIARVVATARLDRTPAFDERLGVEARTAAATARRLLERGTVDRDWPEIRRSLDDLGDALATEALAEMAYAVSLGWAEDLPLTALAAFRRHVFTRPSSTGMLDASWLAPDILTARGAAWHVVGSLLGLGDALAPVALRRPSLKPLGAAPSLNTGDRPLARHHHRRARSRPLHRRRAAAAGCGVRTRRGPPARHPRRRRGAPGRGRRRGDAAPPDAGGVDRRGKPAGPGRRPVDDRDRAAGFGRRRAAGIPGRLGDGAAARLRTHHGRSAAIRGRGNAMPGDPSGWYRAPCRICR